MASKRNDLTLAQKYEVIKTAEREKSIGVRKLSQVFGCGKTQISTILRNKEKIKELYEKNVASDICHTNQRVRESKYSDVNKALYQWYLLAVSKNVFPDGTQLAEKAKEIASKLGLSDFKASNGWLDRWKKKHNIKKMTISGESGDVSGSTVSSWKERLPEIIEGYGIDDIWNLDETGVFWQALPDKGFGQRVRQCKGGKKSKQRITVAFIVNAAGRSEGKPIVIWKSENPRCFKGVKKEDLPVEYQSQPKAWMTGDILHKVLSKANRKLRLESRSVLLLMDNAGCHPPDMFFSNIKIVFLPANTTSVLQPLDLGIIKTFKVHYRKFLMKFVLSKIDTCSNASQVVKSVTILHAVRWVAEAWKYVSEITVKKCFRQAGILKQDFSVVDLPSEADPFADLDETSDSGHAEEELTHLMNAVQGQDCACTLEEIFAAENDVPICSEFADDAWDETFMDELQPSISEAQVNSEEDECEQDMPDPPAKRIKTYKEAVECLEDVRHFLEDKGHTKEATETDTLVNKLTSFQCSKISTMQSYITSYFKPN